MTFLEADWRKLVVANFIIDEKILTAYLPAGTELDYWNGNCYISLIGFMFQNTKLLGLKIPYHINFEEVNLRFYVKRFEDGKWKRGVVFIKEIVPRPALTFVANTVYKEHYETCKMAHTWRMEGTEQTIEYAWQRSGKWNSLKVCAGREPIPIIPNTEIEFITEHYWGYAKVNGHKSIEYEVTHPTWHVYEIKSHAVEVDFGQIYGRAFDFLNELIPSSVMLAEGSPITIGNKKTIMTDDKK